MADLMKEVRASLVMLILLSITTGLIYPGIVTAIAQMIFPIQANGSLIVNNNQTVGSALIGQGFEDAKYFWSRPSATSLFPYNAQASGGSNAGPLNADFLAVVKTRIDTLKKGHTTTQDLIPVDMVTASGSGLDPEISPYAAYYQIERIAKARSKSIQSIQALVQANTKQRTFGILGEPRVNVLKLNLALDAL